MSSEAPAKSIVRLLRRRELDGRTTCRAVAHGRSEARCPRCAERYRRTITYDASMAEWGFPNWHYLYSCACACACACACDGAPATDGTDARRASYVTAQMPGAPAT